MMSYGCKSIQAGLNIGADTTNFFVWASADLNIKVKTLVMIALNLNLSDISHDPDESYRR